MILETYTSGPCETNTYVVGCPVTHKAFVVDAPPESLQWILKTVKTKGLVVEKIFLTHSHWDHIADAGALKDETNAQILVHPLDVDNLQNPGADGLPIFFPIQGALPDLLLEEGDVIRVGTLSVQVLCTPGHSPGGVCLYLQENNVLFSGDTVFAGTMGRIDFPTSSPKDMWTSLLRLSKLPKDVKVYPGHGHPTLIGKETWMETAQKRFQ